MTETPEGRAKRQMVSPSELAIRWDVDRETVLRWIRDGKLPAVRLSKRLIKVRIADADAFEAARAA